MRVLTYVCIYIVISNVFNLSTHFFFLSFLFSSAHFKRFITFIPTRSFCVPHCFHILYLLPLVTRSTENNPHPLTAYHLVSHAFDQHYLPRAPNNFFRNFLHFFTRDFLLCIQHQTVLLVCRISHLGQPHSAVASVNKSWSISIWPPFATNTLDISHAAYCINLSHYTIHIHIKQPWRNHTFTQIRVISCNIFLTRNSILINIAVLFICIQSIYYNKV